MVVDCNLSDRSHMSASFSFRAFDHSIRPVRNDFSISMIFAKLYFSNKTRLYHTRLEECPDWKAE